MGSKAARHALAATASLRLLTRSATFRWLSPARPLPHARTGTVVRLAASAALPGALPSEASASSEIGPRSSTWPVRRLAARGMVGTHAQRQSARRRDIREQAARRRDIRDSSGGRSTSERGGFGGCTRYLDGEELGRIRDAPPP